MIPGIAKALFDAFASRNEELFLVGGCVRDFVLSEILGYEFEPKDLDFATSATPTTTEQILIDLEMPFYEIGIEYGTVGTCINGIGAEITTYRCKESYTKGSRKPAVHFGKTLEEDLKRRDFTVNAMAMDANGAIIDPFYGQESAKNGRLLTPSENPMEIFTDDPLRMLRGYRFESQLGLELHPIEHAMVRTLRAEIHHISAERIVTEMTKLLIGENAGRALKRMGDSGLLGEIFPEIQTVIDFKQNQGKWHSKLVWPHTIDVVDNAPRKAEVRWAALFHDIAKPETYSETDTGVHFYEHEPKGAYIWNDIADRLKMPTEFKRTVNYLIFHHLRFPNLCAVHPRRVSKSALRRFIRDCGPYLDDLYHLSMADITSHHPDVVKEKRQLCTELKERLDEIIAECDVRQLKLPKGLGSQIASHLKIAHGPELGSIMRRLNDALVAGVLFDKPFTLESDLLAAASEVKSRQDRIGRQP